MIKIVLGLAAVGGIVVAGATAGNAIQILKYAKTFSRRQKYHINETIYNLKKKGLVTVQSNGYFKLTKKGELRLAGLEMDFHSITKPKTWDKKFRVVIFDIEEAKRKIRTAIRIHLLGWGFVRLQNSVWVHPYECREAIDLLKTNFGLSTDVLFLTVEEIENDRWIKSEFGLT